MPPALRAAQVFRVLGLIAPASLSSELPNDAASRAYYGAFHAASALLLSEGLAFNSYTSVLRGLSLHFVKTGILEPSYGRDSNWLAEVRQIADYGELKNVATTDAEQAVAIAELFLRKVRQLLEQEQEDPAN
ncbi:MAG: HEPN domain-containing protein [Cyanobacteria bacterium J06638_22]